MDQSPEGPKANLAIEGKPWIINPVAMIVHLKFMQLLML
jgi:hypothetical protein